MRPPASILRRALTVILAVSPLVASTDLCTVGALTGRAELACAMESGGPACGVTAAPAPKCSHCAPATPARETPRSHGPTCCDLRPQAAAVAGQPMLAVPLPTAHPAVAPAAVAPDVVTASAVRVAPDVGRAPPRDVAVVRSPRAPPLG
jgi:hypothetical protein